MSRPIYKNQCLIMSELISIPNPHHQSTKTVEITITQSLNKQCDCDRVVSYNSNHVEIQSQQVKLKIGNNDCSKIKLSHHFLIDQYSAPCRTAGLTTGLYICPFHVKGRL